MTEPGPSLSAMLPKEERSGPAFGTPAFNRYLAAIVLICAAAVGVPLFSMVVGEDVGATRGLYDFAAISLKGNPAWYRDFGGRWVPEIQDEDLFYHNIGPSIAEAERADIILLGPSFVSYALDPDLLRQFGERYGIKIYNMAFIGVRSGEFTLRVIRRWKLHPKIWIVNVDDQFVHFFSSSLVLQFGPQSMPIRPVEYDRLHGWLTVANRNIRWRTEDLWARLHYGKQVSDSSIYRNVDDGGVYVGRAQKRYFASDNSVIALSRDQNCHTDAATIKQGRDYLAEIGGQAILTLVPHSQYCPQQARELAAALGTELILSPTWQYTTLDGGGHLDHNGAVAFTKAFLSSLADSKAFKKLLQAIPAKAADAGK